MFFDRVDQPKCRGVIHRHVSIPLGRKGAEAFTKRLLCVRCLSYDERLQKLGLPRLELRRLHLDLIFCYKIVFGLVCVNFNDFFEFNLTTRGHAYKLFKPREYQWCAAKFLY